MPDATITSTASTFGTISGTFAADQSTITGTITAITGTVDGSVGVPGPQGPAGAAGPQGPQGDPGAPGVVAATAPLFYDSGTQTVYIDSQPTFDSVTATSGAYSATLDPSQVYINGPDGGVFLDVASGLSLLNSAGASITFPDSTIQTTAYPGPDGSAVWGSITGTLSSQTDLNTALAGKYSTTNPAGFITASALTGYATESWVTGELGSYLPLAGGVMSGSITSVGATHDTEMSGELFGVQLSADHTKGSVLQFNGLDTYDGASHMLVTPSGLTFPDASVQTTAYTGGGSFITSVTSPLSVTSGDLSVDLSAYLTSATAASTYAVIAAGQPVAGTTGQVLTKQSGSNWDSIWATPVVGDRYLTTSTTSNTIGNGTKTFTIGTGLSYTPTQSITIAYDAANHMHGEVLTYNSGTGVLTVDINHHTGAGTYAAWVVNIAGVVPATSVAWGAITGTLSSQTDLQSALDLKLAATTAATTYYPLVGNPSSFLVAADITGKANIASPSLTGTPLSTTAAVDTNTTQISTTAFVVGQAASATPLVNGTAAVGTSLRYARADHVHGTDTTRAPLASPAFTGNVSFSGGATVSSITMNSGNSIIIPDGGAEIYETVLQNKGLLIRDSVNTPLARFQADEVLIPSVGITFSDATVQTSAGLTAATAAATYAPKASPTFTGTVTIPAGASISGYATSTDLGLKANIASPTFTGLVNTAASAAGTAGFRLPHGSAPTSPTNGDVWTTTAGLFYQVNGATVSPATLAGGTFTGKITTVASAAGTAGFRLPNGAAPTTPVSGDLWTTSAGIFANIGALATQQLAMLGATTNFTGTFTLSGATANLGNSTAASTTNVASGATLAATTKTVNIGTNGVATSVTNINVGSAVSTTTITLNGTVNATGLSNSVKAWVNFNGTGTPAIRASYNVSSITDNGVGDYTVNFTTALADANYSVNGTANDSTVGSTYLWLATGGALNSDISRTTSLVRVQSIYGTNLKLDASTVNVTIIR